MKVTCTGRRVTLKPSFIENAEKRLAKLDKFFPDEAQAQVTVTVEKSGQTVEIMLRSKDLAMRAEKTDERMEDALADAVDLIRFSEDQFVCWDVLPDDDGVRTLCTPCVYEQYGYRVPVDNSTCVVANALLDLCEATGDRLAFAKAKALADNLTVVQNALDGLIPTSLDVREGAKNRIRGFWVNCTYASILTLLRMAELTGETAGFPADVPRAR